MILFSERLKNALEERNITQVELAKELGFTSAAVNRWCQNITEPDNKTLVDIAKYLKVSTDFLLGNDEILNKDDEALKEKIALTHILIKAGYLNESEQLPNDELDRLMNFVRNNKDFIKGNK